MIKQVIRTSEYPVVETKQGKLHGYQEDAVFHFYGIRYGRAERFSLPRPEEPWEGVRDAKSYGFVCPLLPEPELKEDDPMSAPWNSFEQPHVYWPMKEQCLYLNVWTKHLDQKAKRPVLVWIHGGGYCTGSSIEIPSYDGHNFCDQGDVVFVSLNHRLNCIGFLDLSSFGEKYRYSGCAGMADIVLALNWVKENIAAFGGDPDNVTIAGQSGGGGKTAILMQMPSADGLYAKVISQSGSLAYREELSLQEEKRHWQKLGEAVVEELGLTEDTIDEICTVDYDVLAAASVRAGEKLGYAGGMMLFEPSPVEGFYVGSSAHAGFRRKTADIPVIAGTVLGEFSFMHYFGEKSRYSEQEKRAILEETYGEKTDEVIRNFLQIYPDLDILYALSVDTMFRSSCRKFLERREEMAEAPVYNYLMQSIIPYQGGLAPWHCSEIPFAFRNVERDPSICTAYRYAEKLQDCVSGAWLAFMENGNPSTDQLEWKPFSKESSACMVFDETSRMENRDDRKLQEMLKDFGGFFV